MKRIIHRISSYFGQQVRGKAQQIKIFGILFFINYPAYYFVWEYVAKQSYENLLLRISASMVCFPLIFYKKWPKILENFKPLYWLLSVSYCLPFFFTYMTFRNDFSVVWLLNLMLSIFLSLILLDLISWLFSIFIGFLAAYLAYFATEGLTITYNPGLLDFTSGFATFVAAIAVGGIFLHYREKTEKEKLEVMQSLGSTIAHELRTPLAAININVSAIKNYLPDLVDAYRKAKDNELPIKRIGNSQLTALEGSLTHIHREIQFATTFITMLLAKVDYSKVKTDTAKESICSMADCVEQALERYPFYSKEKSLIKWNKQNNFQFKGSELLIIHVFFNLIKNALYYIAAAGQGGIDIWFEYGDKYNKVYFQDTGTGISPDVLPRIFARFYTKTTYGAGVGLAFCKEVMQALGGDIRVDSVEGEYAQFVLYFPRITGE